MTSFVWLCRSHHLFLRKEYAYPQITPVNKHGMRKLAAVSIPIFNGKSWGVLSWTLLGCISKNHGVKRVMLAVASCLDPASFLDISPLHCHVIAHVCHMRQCLRENKLTSLFLRWVTFHSSLSSSPGRVIALTKLLFSLFLGENNTSHILQSTTCY